MATRASALRWTIDAARLWVASGRLGAASLFGFVAPRASLFAVVAPRTRRAAASVKDGVDRGLRSRRCMVLC